MSSTRLSCQLLSRILSRYSSSPRLMCRIQNKIAVRPSDYFDRLNVSNLRSLSSLRQGDTTQEKSTDASDGSNIVEEIMPDLARIIKERSKFRTPNLRYVEGLIKILASFKLRPSEIIDCLAENHEEINKLGHETLVDKVGYLRSNGFHPSEVVTLLRNSPQVLSMKKETIKQVLQAYMGIGVPDGRIQLLLAKEPALFYFTEKQVHQRVNKLGMYFTRKEIIEIASDHPNVFLDSWENIENKFKYVIKVMGLEVKHLKKFEVFEHNLLHMKIRHKLLHKAGLYQTPDKAGTTEIENANITRIMDSSDKVFAIQVAGLSMDELEAFKKMEEFESILESLEEDLTSEEEEDDDDDDVDDERDNEDANPLHNISEEERITLQRLAKYKRDKMT